MSIVALVLVATSFAWLGILLSDRTAPHSRPIASAGPINALDPEAKQPAGGVAPVEGATTRSAGADEFALGSASESSSGTATLVSASKASHGAPDERKVDTRQAETSSTSGATEPPAGVQPVPATEDEEIQPPRPVARVESATVSNAQRTPSSPSTRMGSSTRESRRFAPSPDGKPGVTQQQWALLRPPTQASPAAVGPVESISSGGVASRRARTTPATSPVGGEASGSAEQPKQADVSVPQSQTVGTGIAESPNGQSNPSAVTLDNDPARRERWLRDQLQIR